MAKRESINLPGMAHGAPIPMGSKIGNIVHSSGISGRDQVKNVMPEDPQEQANCLFDNVRQFMEIAGGSPADILHMTFFMNDEKDRDFINGPWKAMFPDEHSRPSRHAVTTEVRQGRFQAELMAVIGG